MTKNIWEIEKLMGLRKIKSIHHTGGCYYEGTVSTGNFNALDDYGKGLLSLKIGQHNTHPNCKISISTIDDGVWQGFSNQLLEPNTIETITKEFTKTYGIKLPSEKEFNTFLNNYGIHGLYTG